ncbi:LysR family transcriptional regulator [Pseudonocardia sp. TRM90224]|uniref:LysR family transcriptional regulator n=1 Tax=Pseudonocardia sp. TRM90224 TaxID=2812678 RepID=UPI001E467D13|nr:LysR family transcriptional regulator [Pseudonocardia sp. TRM90224]
MSFDLVDLRLFAAVVEHGSLTRGAEQLPLSLPSASARIQAMESRLGAPLLRRHHRGVTPTATGGLLAGHAREIIAMHERMTNELAERTDTTVVLWATYSAAATLLPDLLIDFLSANIDVAVDLVPHLSRRIVPAVAEGRIELGVAADSTDLGRLETTPLRSDQLVVAVADGHPLAERAEVAFVECLDHPLVGLVAGTPLQELLHGYARPLGVRPRYRARLADTASVHRAVAAGVGIAVLPEAAAVAPGLRMVPLTDPWARRNLVLCRRPGVPLTSGAGRLAEHLVAHAR